MNKKPICQQLHYLQMATEKLAKAYLCGPNDEPPPKVHQALVKLFRLAKGRSDLRKKFGFENVHAFRSYIESLLSLAEDIQDLAPVGDGGFGKSNSEYPWKKPSGEIVCPLDDEFTQIYSHGDMRINKMQKLIPRLIREASR